MLTPVELREGSRRARELALKEPTAQLRQGLAAHALDLAWLAERLERDCGGGGCFRESSLICVKAHVSRVHQCSTVL